MKKLLLASLVGSLLVGCGGDDSGSTTQPPVVETPPPAVEGGELPDIGVDYEGHEPPAVEGGDLPDIGVDPELVDQELVEKIARLLNWDIKEITEICQDQYVECVIEDDLPKFKVKDHFRGTVYSPLSENGTFSGVNKITKKFQDSYFRPCSTNSNFNGNCNVSLLEGEYYAIYNGTPDLIYLEQGLSSVFYNSVASFWEVSNATGADGMHGVGNASLFTPNTGLILHRIMYEKALVNPSTPALPTTPCEEGMDCMDEGFTNPSLPMIPVIPSTPIPTTPCEEGMDCMDEGFTNPSLPMVPVEPSKPTVESLISKALNWDIEEIIHLCGLSKVECVIEDGLPKFKVNKNLNDEYVFQTIYSPLDVDGSKINGFWINTKIGSNLTYHIEYKNPSANSKCAVMELPDVEDAYIFTYQANPNLEYLEDYSTHAGTNYLKHFCEVTFTSIDNTNITTKSRVYPTEVRNDNAILGRIMYETALTGN